MTPPPEKGTYYAHPPPPLSLDFSSPRIPPTRQRHRRTSPLLGLHSMPFDQQPTITRASRVLDTQLPNGVGTCKSAAPQPAAGEGVPRSYVNGNRRPNEQDGAVLDDEGTLDWVLRLSNNITTRRNERASGCSS